jgi:hypothetical protein
LSDPTYYGSWETVSSNEVARDAAEKLPRYARAWRRPDGALERLELYDRGQLVRVDYHGASDAAIAASHQARYPGITRIVHQPRGDMGGFHWSASQGTAGDGTPTSRAIELSDDAGRSLMTIEIDGNGAPATITKYFWDGAGELRYVFEYDQKGRFVAVQDLEYGDSASLDDLKHVLTDAPFFETGLALPGAIAGTRIPDLAIDPPAGGPAK